MFVNHYERSLDSKHRVVLPAKFRNFLGERVYLAPQDSSLAVFSETEYTAAAERLQSQVRAGEISPMTRRAFATGTVEVDIDSAGRITIPQRLREFADLKNEVVVSGMLNYFEIWDKETYSVMEEELVPIVQESFKAGGTIS